jgi:large subunit ribosomal protein L17
MRHKTKRSNFHRRPGPRVALIRGYVYSLVQNGRIKTTVARAKEVRRHVEKAITLGKKDSLHARRLLLSRYPNEAVVSLLAGDLQKRFAKRPGGYTRIVKIGARAGDQSDMAFLEFVDFVPKATAGEETVKGDVASEARKKVGALEAARLRKNVRRMQNTSRRQARA